MGLLKRFILACVLIAGVPLLCSAHLFYIKQYTSDGQSTAYVPFLYGPVKLTDHLWQIAKMARPSRRITLQQTMLALLNKNPSSFLANNVNALKKGSMLYLPSWDKITQLSAAQAERLVARQNRQWHQQGAKNYFGGEYSDGRARSESSFQGTRLSSNEHTRFASPHRFVQLDQDLSETEHELSRLKTSINERFKAIEIKTQDLQGQIQQENTLLSALTGMVINLNKVLQDETVLALNRSADSSNPLIRSNGFLLLSVMLFMLLITLFVFYKRSYTRRKLNVSVSHSNQPASAFASPSSHAGTERAEDQPSRFEHEGRDEEEYDYWGSQEGILAKLDLVRAYIDMGETVQAKNTLKEVVEKGSDAQKEEARRLLSKLESAAQSSS